MDPAIIFIILFSIIILIILGLGITYREQVGQYVVDNKAFSTILLVFIVYTTYQWYLYREQKKKKMTYSKPKNLPIVAQIIGKMYLQLKMN